jgi:hypothetical protein
MFNSSTRDQFLRGLKMSRTIKINTTLEGAKDIVKAFKISKDGKKIRVKPQPISKIEEHLTDEIIEAFVEMMGQLQKMVKK